MTAASFWTAIFCYQPVGVVSLVFAAIDRAENDEASSCGQEGSPPVRDWLWGTGIAFVIMAGAGLMVSSCFSTTEDRGIFGIVSGCSSCFILAWAIVGTISLARDGNNCKEEDPMLWKVSLVMLIITWILACCGGGAAVSTKTVQGDVSHTYDAAAVVMHVDLENAKERSQREVCFRRILL